MRMPRTSVTVLAAALFLLPFARAATAAPPSVVGGAGSAAIASPDSAPPRLASDPAPTAESVDLDLDPGRPDYRGHVTIALAVRAPARELRFHARAMSIDSVTLTGPSGRVPIAEIATLIPDQVRVRPAASLAPGAYLLSIRFHNHFNTRAVSLYRVLTGGHAYLFTQFEDTEAREAFPCWDEPSFKIPWSVSLTVPGTDLAVGNTPIARRTRAGDQARVVFERTPPLSSYLVAVAVGPFETVPIPGLHVPGRVVTVQGAGALAADAVRITPAIVHSLEHYFGRPYPFAKLDLIAAPEFLYGAMENAGAVVFADRRLLIDPNVASPDQRRQLTGIIAHELAHMWFGDLVTMRWWDDLWLNESFASWMATKVEDEVTPEDHAGVSALLSAQRAFATDARPSTRAMRGRITGATSLGLTANELAYNKGEAVLTMFEGWLGVEKFRAGVLDYLDTHAWSNAEGRDLWRALGRASGENVDDAMASFLDQPGVPEVTVTPRGGGRVTVSQQRFLSIPGATRGPERWRIPVLLRYPAPGGTRTRRVWLIDAETLVDLGTGTTPGWIVPNGGASGYYRWRVPDAMLDSLVAAAPRALTLRERIDLVTNVSAQLRAGTVRGDHYLTMMAQLADDASPEVVRAVLESLNETRVALLPAEDSTATRYLRAALEPALARFGMRPRPDEPIPVALVRPLLLSVLADGANDPRVIAFADSLCREYLLDPRSIPASLVETAIVLGAMHGDRARFETYRARFERATVPIDRTRFLIGLGRFRDPELRAAALDYSLHGPLRPQETLMVPGAMADNSTGSERGGGSYPDEVTRWMFDHFDSLAARLPPNFTTRLMAFGNGCSEERLHALDAFFHDPARRVLGGAPTLLRLEDVIRECSGLHAREAERVERWLRSGDARTHSAAF